MSLLLPLLLCAGPGGAADGDLLDAWDFEADDGGFLAQGELAEWEWGVPTAGPGSAFDGTRAWATLLDAPYLHDTDAVLRLPAVDLTAADRPVLVLHHWLELGSGDVARIEVFDDGDWGLVPPIYGYPDVAGFTEDVLAWTPVYVDLSGLTSLERVRLVLSADEAGRADGWYVDAVAVWDGDVVPPRIAQVEAPITWERTDEAPTVGAEIRDDVGLVDVQLAWRAEDDDAWSRTPMAVDGADRFLGTLPLVAPGTVVEWRIEASDTYQTALFPDGDPATVLYTLPAPRDLVGPDAARWWGTTVPLAWSAPDTAQEVLGYRVYRDGEPVLDTTAPEGDAPALGPVDRFTVTARYLLDDGESEEEVEGDASDFVDVEVAVPALTALDPAEAWQGDVLRVSLAGTDLLLQAEVPPVVELGDGVTVQAVEVAHVDRATLTLAVAADAALGARDVTVTTGGETLVLADAFQVRSGQDRPTIEAVEPQGLTQGSTATVTVTVPADSLDGTPVVELGDGVVVEAVEVVPVDGGLDEVRATVAVANDARVGARTVRVDDGLRILSSEDAFRVYARTVEVDSTCATAGSSPRAAPGLVLLLALPLLSRRRASRGRAG